MVKRLIFNFILFFTLISCEEDMSLFDLHSSRIYNSSEYNLESMDSDDVNDILCSLINEVHFSSSFDEYGITYDIIDNRLNYDISYCYHIEDNYYYGMAEDVHCNDFICINNKCSLYTKGQYYICELDNILLFNVEGDYYQVPYTIIVETDLHKVIDITLSFN